jgi:DNA-binding MarR family transcriptional regulator
LLSNIKGGYIVVELYAREIEDSEEFFSLVYRDIFEEQNAKAFLTLKDKEDRRAARTLQGVKKHGSYCHYFTPNIFWHHKLATKEHMLWLDAIILDFDDAKNGNDRRFKNGGEVGCHVLEKTGFIPRLVWESKTKGNYHALILINPMTGTPKSIYLYEKMAKAIAAAVGADTGATNSNNLISIPKKMLWELPGGEIYDIDDFKKWYSKTIEEKIANLNITSIDEYKIWNHPAIKKLLNGEIQEWRNRACFTIGLLYYAFGKDKEDAYDFLANQWIKYVNGPGWRERFKLSEVKSCVKSAYSGKYKGPKREYIELITGEEFPFVIYQSVYKKKSIEDGGYYSKNDVRQAIVDFLRENNGITIKQQELAEKINKPYRSVERNIKEMQKEGVIEIETQRGRHSKGSTIKLLENEMEIKKADIKITATYDENNLEDFLKKA